MGFIPGMQGWFTIQKSISVIHHNNRLKKKNSVVTSINAEKAFEEKKKKRKSIWQNSTPIHLKNKNNKTSQKSRNRRELPQLTESIYKKPRADIIPNGERLNASPLRSETRQCCPFSELLFHTVLEYLASAMRQGKEIKDTQIGKK